MNDLDPASFARVRARFPGTARGAYLDVASRSLMPASSQSIAAAHIAERMAGTIDKDGYFALIERVRGAFAQLVNAGSDEIAFTKNVSEGLNLIASSVDWRRGDRVLLCSDIEHPNNVYTWRNLERLGVEVLDLPAAQGQFPIDAAIGQLQAGPAPRAVTVSATSFKPGFRTDLGRLGRACRQAGALLVVDGAQAAGITHLDVRAMDVDALAVSTQKGLCSLYGMGFLYVRRELAERLAPLHLARFGVTIAATHEADYDRGPIQYQPGARRFDLGNYNFLAAALVEDALALIASCGTPAIDRYVTALAGELADGLADAGYRVQRAPAGLGANIVCVEFGADAQAAQPLQAHLRAHGVQAAVRRNLLRFSAHFYNDRSDIQAALRAARDWPGRRGANGG